MAFEFVSIEKMGRVAVVRFDRKDGVNALSRDLKRELIDAARTFEDDTETSAIVLTGAADVFSLGFDLKDPTNAEVQAAGLADRRKITQLGPRLCRGLGRSGTDDLRRIGRMVRRWRRGLGGGL